MVWSQFRLSNIRRLPQRHTGTSGHRSRGCDITVPPNLNKEMNRTSAKSALTKRLWNRTGIQKYHSCLFLPRIRRRMHIFLSMEKTSLLLNYRLCARKGNYWRLEVFRESAETTRVQTGTETHLLPAFFFVSSLNTSQWCIFMSTQLELLKSLLFFFSTKMRWVYTAPWGSAMRYVGSSLMNSPLQLISFPKYPLESQKVSHENSSKLSECMECNLRLVIHPA